MGVLQELGVPRNAGFYICGPAAFINDLTAGLAAWGVAKGQSTQSCSVPVRPILQASPPRRKGRRTCRLDRPVPGR